MTKDNYRTEISKAQAAFTAKKRELDIDYAKANNPYKKGDRVQDHLGTGEIISIHLVAGHGSDFPCCSYKCKNLTQKGTRNKVHPTRVIYQGNIVD